MLPAGRLSGLWPTDADDGGCAVGQGCRTQAEDDVRVWAFSRVSGRTERDRVLERRSGVMRDPGPALAILAEASQLRPELMEAVRRLEPADQLEARGLIGQLEETIATLSFALALTAPADPPAGS
jgi:hypothetical protein